MKNHAWWGMMSIRSIFFFMLCLHLDVNNGSVIFKWLSVFPGGGGKGILPEKLGGGVWPTSQNPYPIYDQNLWYSLPHLWPDQIFDTLFMTWPLNRNPVSDLCYNKFPISDQCWITINIICGGLLLIFFSIMMKKWLLLKNIPISRLECKNHTLFMTKMAKIG